MRLRDSYDAIMTRAQNAMGRGEWAAALAEYRRIVDHLSKLGPAALGKHEELKRLFEEGLDGLLFLLNLTGQYGEAIDVLERLPAIMPENEATWKREAARFRVRQGDVERGATELQALAAARPDDPLLEIGLGEVEIERGDRQQAMAHFARAADIASEPELQAIAQRLLLDGHMLLQQWDQAEQAWERAVALDQTVERLLPWMYQVFLSKGLTDRARSYIRREKNPYRRGLYAGLADYLDGDVDGAHRHWRKVLKQRISPGDEGLDSWIEAGLRLGEPETVLQQVSPVLDTGKTSTRAAVLIGMALAMVGDTERADRILGVVREQLGLDRLPRADWLLFDTLTEDEAVKEAIKHHFATEEPEQDTPEPAEMVSDAGEGPPADEPDVPDREPASAAAGEE